MEWELKKISISELKEYEKNPRKFTSKGLADLKKSIEKFGVAEPLVVNNDYEIIGGHGRLATLKDLGIAFVDCYFPKKTLTKKQVEELNIRLNKNIAGEWDFDLLSGFDEEMLVDIGWDGSELDKIFVKDNSDLDEFDAPDESEAITKLGDIYLLGKHRLMCGDSTKKADVERLMQGEKADMVFTDPPYDLETKGGGVLKHSAAMKGIRELNIDNFDPFVLQSMAKTEIFCCNKNLVKKYLELAESWGKAYDICFYKKENTAPNYGGHMMTDTEYLIIIGSQSPNSGLPKDTYSKAFIGNKDNNNDVAWSKPIALIEKFLILFSNRDDIIVDIFGGSGSTLIACEQLNRKCYMMEIDPKYCDVIISRWENLTNKKAEKIK